MGIFLLDILWALLYIVGVEVSKDPENRTMVKLHIVLFETYQRVGNRVI